MVMDGGAVMVDARESDWYELEGPELTVSRWAGDSLIHFVDGLSETCVSDPVLVRIHHYRI
ncbi:hypothetical protein E1B28_002974 [Marasmius oreades]|uniref:Uncharacterized protein n=1 Tax=Marasmius oreades TaxID=181124 RepID=A0A9P7UJW9_9AGAR|nr:uncharacterized protein E1B28_002974 [Marasmius oreades]KAG7085413.1 hypothetical protein E1B28_002974 [Marasmius oreades]